MKKLTFDQGDLENLVHTKLERRLVACKDAITNRRANWVEEVDRVLIPVVLEHGRVFRGLPRPKGVRKKPGFGRCTINAWELVEDQPRLAYTEGYAWRVENDPFDIHAWCVGEESNVVDATFRDPESYVYIGIPLEYDSVVEGFYNQDSKNVQPILQTYVKRHLAGELTRAQLKDGVASIMHPWFLPQARRKAK